jgi:2-oxoglutarate ferredoxin oxidoreductase subunit beta
VSDVKNSEQTIKKNLVIPVQEDNRIERFLKLDSTPHIHCPTYGVGMAVHCFTKAQIRSKIPLESMAVVSGIRGTGRVAGNLKVDSFHTTQGRAIPFAIGLKVANPNLNVVVLSTAQDLVSIGGNHFMNVARRNIDLTVICVNNFNYTLLSEQEASDSYSQQENENSGIDDFVSLFNLAYLAESTGAVYVARWTALHIHQVITSISEALNKKGFSFIEILTPYPDYFKEKRGSAEDLNRLKVYFDKSRTENNANTKNVGIESGDEIIVGKFVDGERPTFMEKMNQHYQKVFGEKYTPYDG